MNVDRQELRGRLIDIATTGITVTIIVQSHFEQITAKDIGRRLKRQAAGLSIKLRCTGEEHRHVSRIEIRRRDIERQRWQTRRVIFIGCRTDRTTSDVGCKVCKRDLRTIFCNDDGVCRQVKYRRVIDRIQDELDSVGTRLWIKIETVGLGIIASTVVTDLVNERVDAADVEIEISWRSIVPANQVSAIEHRCQHASELSCHVPGRQVGVKDFDTVATPAGPGLPDNLVAGDARKFIIELIIGQLSDAGSIPGKNLVIVTVAPLPNDDVSVDLRIDVLQAVVCDLLGFKAVVQVDLVVGEVAAPPDDILSRDLWSENH